MALTYEPIQTYTASGSSGTITFSSIPSTYTDLVLIIAGNTVNGNTYIQFNSDTGSNYSRTALRGDGTTASSFRQSAQIFISLDGSVSQPAQNIVANIMNYSNTTTNKTAIWRSNNAGAGTEAMVGLWRSTSAITRVDVVLQTANFSSGSTFTLYGIKAA